MGGYWINVFRRPDGRLVSREDLRDGPGKPGGLAQRRSAEAPMLYQGQCRFLYRIRIRPRDDDAARCGRVSDSGFVALSGDCHRCGLGALTSCASAFRVGMGDAATVRKGARG
jgi:hypothetical protein